MERLLPSSVSLMHSGRGWGGGGLNAIVVGVKLLNNRIFSTLFKTRLFAAHDRLTLVLGAQIRSWRVYDGLIASGGLRHSVYYSLKCLWQNISLVKDGISILNAPFDV